MLLLLLVLVVLVAAVLVHAVGGARPPRGVERAYLALSPVPLVVGLLLPAAIGFLSGFTTHKVWIDRSGWGGVVLSLVLLVVGLALIIRSVLRGERWGSPLGISVVLAAMPFAIVVLAYGLWHVLTVATRLR